MERLTYLTAGDATRQPHYAHGPGIKKDDLLQRLGKCEDALELIWSVCHKTSASQMTDRLNFVYQIVREALE